MTIALQFLGAARHVTGTKHLLIVNEKQVLLDCGMVQGPREMSNKANRTLPLDAQKVTAVVLSHAHIDHSGSLPKLVKDGFRSPIWCTNATRDLVTVLLKDSAHIQEQHVNKFFFRQKFLFEIVNLFFACRINHKRFALSAFCNYLLSGFIDRSCVDVGNKNFRSFRG